MYIILEFQTTGGTTAIVPPVQKDTLEKAQQAFYSTCSYAAVSSVEQHVVVLMFCNGNVIEKNEFRHLAEPEPIEEE